MRAPLLAVLLIAAAPVRATELTGSGTLGCVDAYYAGGCTTVFGMTAGDPFQFTINFAGLGANQAINPAEALYVDTGPGASLTLQAGQRVISCTSVVVVEKNDDPSLGDFVQFIGVGCADSVFTWEAVRVWVMFDDRSGKAMSGLNPKVIPDSLVTFPDSVVQIRGCFVSGPCDNYDFLATGIPTMLAMPVPEPVDAGLAAALAVGALALRRHLH